jgi:hypothetical protein
MTQPTGLDETVGPSVRSSESKKNSIGTDDGQFTMLVEDTLQYGPWKLIFLTSKGLPRPSKGFLLVDAANAFNELNRTAMLWTIRHEWPSGARFASNCYRHWATLVIRGKGGTVVLIFSKEGVTQGDPLSMFGYGIGILPLICKLTLEFPAVKQPWYYADDAGAGAASLTCAEFCIFGSKN